MWAPSEGLNTLSLKALYVLHNTHDSSEGLTWLLRVSCLLADFCNLIAAASSTLLITKISSSYKEKTENNASHCFVVMLCDLYPQFGSIIHTSLQQNKATLLIIKVFSIAHIFVRKKYNYMITKDFRKKLLLKIRRKSRIKKVKLKQVSSNWSFHLCFQFKKKLFTASENFRFDILIGAFY